MLRVHCRRYSRYRYCDLLFGSYAKGDAKEQSDVDILVDSGLRGLAFFGLLEDVVTALGKEVDLLDVSQLTLGSQVNEEISRSGVVIYEQQTLSRFASQLIVIKTGK